MLIESERICQCLWNDPFEAKSRTSGEILPSANEHGYGKNADNCRRTLELATNPTVAALVKICLSGLFLEGHHLF